MDVSLCSTLETFDSHDAVTKLNALQTLSQLSTNNANHSSILVFPYVLPLLTTIVQSCDNSLKALALSVIGRFAPNGAVNTQVCETPGLLDAVWNSCLSESKDVRHQAAGALTGFTSFASLRKISGEYKDGESVRIMIKLVKTETGRTKTHALWTLWNLSLTPELVAPIFSSAETEAIEYMIELLTNGDGEEKMNAAAVLGNLSREPRNHEQISKAIPQLINFLRTGDDEGKVYTARCLAALTVNNDQNQETISNQGALQDMVTVLTTQNFSVDICVALSLISTNVKNIPTVIQNGGSAIITAIGVQTAVRAHEQLCACLRNLTVSPEHKQQLAKMGIIEALLSVLNSTCNDSYDEAAAGLWNLALENEVGHLMLDKGAKPILQKVQMTSANKSARESAGGALRALSQIEEGRKEKSTGQESGSGGSGGHIMISYNWTHQPLVLKLAQALKEKGIKIWLDVEQMEGSTLEAMALAVEEASCLLICASQPYQNSRACRTEAEYCYQLKKPFIPLMVEDKRPTGWLGALLGSQLYIDFSKEANFDAKFQELVKTLQKHIKASGSSTVSSSSTVTTTSVATSSSSSGPTTTATIVSVTETNSRLSCREWTQPQISKWLTKYHLEKYIPNFEEEGMMVGLAIEELGSLINEKKLFFTILEKLHISKVGDSLLLRRALKDLISGHYKDE